MSRARGLPRVEFTGTAPQSTYGGATGANRGTTSPSERPAGTTSPRPHRAGSGAQVGEHRAHAPVFEQILLEAQLAEDVPHVRLHRLAADDETLGYRLVRVALGHQRQHVPLSAREVVEGTPGAGVFMSLATTSGSRTVSPDATRLSAPPSSSMSATRSFRR